MPDCSYCDESFESEDEYHSHLEAAHEDELGPIDRRRLGADESEDSAIPQFLLAGVVIGIPIIVLVYLLFFTGSTPGDALPKPDRTPTGVNDIHGHGTIEVTIDGRTLDFSRNRFQNPREYRAFHFEGGDGDVWHLHARQVTLAYAMWTLGIGVENDRVRFDGTTYRDGENATVIVEVNGESVDPTQYVLSGQPNPDNAEQGDHVRIVVSTDS